MRRWGKVHGARRLFGVVLGALLACGLAWGLTGALATSSSPAPPGQVILRVGLTQDCDSLNPFVAWSVTAAEFERLNYNLLVGYNPDFSPRPDLAAELPTKENGGISADGKTWTFKLRHGVTWQDGVPFTAKDVAFTYNYIIKNNLWVFTMYTTGIKRAVALDDYTVQFQLKYPKADMLRLLVPIVPEHIWSKVSPKAAGNTYPNNPPLIGTGPFQLVEAKKKAYYIFKANKQYFGGAPKIDEVIFQIYENPDNMVADLRSGTLDVANDIPQAQFKSLAGAKNLTAIKGAIESERYFDELCFNTYSGSASLGNPVLRDVKFRQALSWAVDKNTLVKVAYGGYAVPGSSIVVPGSEYAWQPSPSEAFGFDLSKASALLDAAGYKLSASGQRLDKQGKPIVLRLWARTEDVRSQVDAKLIAGSFGKLGITVKISVRDEGAICDGLYNMKGNTYAPDYDMYIWGWSQNPDPDYILGVFTTDQINGWNDCCFSNAEYDKLFVEQSRELDPAKRAALVQRMQQIFYDAAPYVVLCYKNYLQAYNSAKWEGWVASPPKNGLVLYTTFNVDSYVKVHPKSATAGTSSSSATGLIVGIIAAVVVAVAVAVVVLRRRRGRALEE